MMGGELGEEVLVADVGSKPVLANNRISVIRKRIVWLVTMANH